MPTLKILVRGLCAVFFITALVALAILLGSDLWLRFQPASRHQPAEALALMSVGASFLCLQFGMEGRRRELLKGTLLGLAFVLWGLEQYLPPGTAVTVIDSVVITIFVVDLGLVIWSSLRREAVSAPPGGDS